MATKVDLQVMAFALVFIILATHLTWGEVDCHHEKQAVMHKCMKTITIVGDYVDPSNKCREIVQESNMACICRNIEIEDQLKISVVKLVRLARQCGKLVPIGSKCGTWTVQPPQSPPSQRAHP
ncbi:unnamed protein product [Urochloa decumbens]|uniref:Bifunctional inhibitor/plant lipid transfer protein/seed storage helical domain-containing protein n=1 Tax=Urochloa decumbens TaxID=240449 RepID=A0ABC9D4D8_9POAL